MNLIKKFKAWKQEWKKTEEFRHWRWAKTMPKVKAQRYNTTLTRINGMSKMLLQLKPFIDKDIFNKKKNQLLRYYKMLQKIEKDY
jgi:hypothetical protein